MICPGSGGSGKRDCSTEGPPLPGVTVADVVADVLAASSEGHSALGVPSYLAERGLTSTTIKTLVDYRQRQRPPLRAAWPYVRAVTDNAAHHKPGLGCSRVHRVELPPRPDAPLTAVGAGDAGIVVVAAAGRSRPSRWVA
jgi:hypothetical protein